MRTNSGSQQKKGEKYMTTIELKNDEKDLIVETLKRYILVNEITIENYLLAGESEDSDMVKSYFSENKKIRNIISKIEGES